MTSVGSGRNNKIPESFQRENSENLVSLGGREGASGNVLLPHSRIGHWKCNCTLINMADVGDVRVGRGMGSVKTGLGMYQQSV